MDIQMPEMDGNETTIKIIQILKKMDPKVQCLVIGLSAYTGDKNKEKSI